MSTVSINGLLAPLVFRLTAASFVFQSAFAADNSSADPWKTTAQTGQVVIQAKFEFCDACRKGFARVMYSGKLGVIDSQARYVVEPIYDDVKDINDAVVPVHIGGKKGKWGILSVTDNRFTVNPSFDDIIGPLNGVYSLVSRAENTMTYVDRKGVKLDASAFKASRHDYNVTLGINKNKFGITNARGEYIGEPIFEQISGEFGVEHLVPACEKNCFPGQDGLWGFIDQLGVFRIRAQFGEAFTFSESLSGNIMQDCIAFAA